MEILNRKERASAFLLFLLMLIITVGVLVFAVFFNYKLPWKENEALRQENDRIMGEFHFQENFSARINELTAQIDSLDRAGDGFPMLEQKITLELAVLEKDVPKDKEAYKNTLLYQNTIMNLIGLVKAKRKLENLKRSEEEIRKLKEETKKYEDIVKQLQKDLELSRQFNR